MSRRRRGCDVDSRGAGTTERAVPAQVELRRFCLERGITYQTFWTLSNRKELASPAMRAAAAAHGVEAQQILFRWLRQRGHQPLTGTKSAEHMAQDLSITTFELSDAEMAEIGALFGVQM